MNELEHEDNEYNFPDSFTYPAVGTLVGSLAVLTMVVLGFVFPEEVSSMDLSQPLSDYNALASAYTEEISLILVLDTVFIVGYTSLFVGFWMLSRDFSEMMSRIGLGLGLIVSIFDLLENAVQITLVQAANSGWSPEPELYGLAFVLNTFIDTVSYAAVLVFAIIFLTIFRPWDRHFILGCLLVLYVIIGLVSLIYPPVLVIRSIFFVIGLIYGGIILWLEEDISSEILGDLLRKEKESKNDFIR